MTRILNLTYVRLIKFCPKFLNLYTSIYGNLKYSRSISSLLYHFRHFIHVRICRISNDGQCRNYDSQMCLQPKLYGICRGFLRLGIHLFGHHLRGTSLLQLVHSIPTLSYRPKGCSHHRRPCVCLFYLTGEIKLKGFYIMSGAYHFRVCSCKSLFRK
jgi:hypothetical protein